MDMYSLYVQHPSRICCVLYDVMLYYTYIVLQSHSYYSLFFFNFFVSCEQNSTWKLDSHPSHLPSIWGGSRRSLSHWRLQALLLSGRLVERLKYVEIWVFKRGVIYSSLSETQSFSKAPANWAGRLVELFQEVHRATQSIFSMDMFYVLPMPLINDWLGGLACCFYYIFCRYPTKW